MNHSNETETAEDQFFSFMSELSKTDVRFSQLANFYFTPVCAILRRSLTDPKRARLIAGQLIHDYWQLDNKVLFSRDTVPSCLLRMVKDAAWNDLRNQHRLALQPLLLEIKELTEQKAKVRVFHDYKEPLWKFAHVIVQRREIAEEITMDVLHKFMEMDLNKFSTVACIKSFLYVSIRNNCLNHLKRRRRSIEKAKNYRYLLRAESIIYPCDTPAEYGPNILRSFKQAIQDLSGQQYNVLYMYLMGYSTAEIASRLKIEKQVVRNYRGKARESLKKSLNIHRKSDLQAILNAIASALQLRRLTRVDV